MTKDEIIGILHQEKVNLLIDKHNINSLIEDINTMMGAAFDNRTSMIITNCSGDSMPYIQNLINSLNRKGIPTTLKNGILKIDWSDKLDTN